MNHEAQSTPDLLTMPLQYVRGVGAERAKLLLKLGLRTARDVLYFFPRDYQDLSDVRSIAELEEDVLQSVRGTIEEIELKNIGSGRSILGVLVRQESGYLRATWFNQAYLKNKLATGKQILLSGKPKLNGLRWEMNHPRVQLLEVENSAEPELLLPVYSLTEGVRQEQIRQLAKTILELSLESVEEVFPEAFLETQRLLSIHQALPMIHFPKSLEQLEQARRRFIYQELFVLQLALAIRQQQNHLQLAPQLTATDKIKDRIIRLLPFELTAGQQQAWQQVAQDMSQSVAMNRLVQGDVGSGKTIVAACAMLLAVANGYQAAFMAPTEILARQHARTMGKLLEKSRVRIGLLTGGLTDKEKSEMLASIESGEIDLVIGTQAILHAQANFKRLGLVVIDEQHKFGVRQRALLKEAGKDPHYLVMTATPIPRTVAMTLFGDLEVSTIADSPPGRQPVYTYLPAQTEQEKWWGFLRKKLQEGRQAYVVVPLVEASEQVAAANLDTTYEALVHGELQEFRVDILHGKMTPAEKEVAMERFRAGEIQVLVATSVIEVGIDVPNATVITILDAQRFGLAQLHQLRGRVCRGTHPGYCCLLASAELDEIGQQRLQALVDSSDGFRLAEIDFSLRGPGDLFGTKQHGLPPLRIANLQRDAEVVAEARHDARLFLESDPGLKLPEHQRLRRMVLVRYGNVFQLGDVG